MSSSRAPCLFDGEDAESQGGPQASDENRELDRAAKPQHPDRGEKERDGHGMPDLHANRIGDSDGDLDRMNLRGPDVRL